MKYRIFCLFFAVFGALTANCAESVTIILPKKASQAEKRAGAVLSHYLHKITRDPIETKETDSPNQAAGSLIFIGENKAFASFNLKSPGKLPDDAFQLEGKNGFFAISGGGADGCEFGVYSFLELLGCRRYSPRDSFFPEINPFRVPSKPAAVEVPAFAYRELHYESAMSPEWARWHKLKTQAQKKSEWGLFVHTFNTLCPQEQYFSQHPEYYGWNGSEYLPGQLCLSNDTVLQIVCANLAAKIAEKPEALYWSVSQNDNYDYCKCPRCQASDRKYGSPAGTLLQFVNAVAARFPQKIISTLAYQYTRQAPRGIKPAKNVSICLCSIECNRGASLETHPGNAGFVRDVELWSALTDRLMIWDYVVQFSSYLCPFPNWHTLQPNAQFFKKYGVNMLFEQGTGRDRSEFSEMRAYFLAKLMWNPDIAADSILRDFRTGYYGPMHDIVEKYINQMTLNLITQPGQPDLQIYGGPATYSNTFLSDAAQIEYWKLLDSVIMRVPEGSLWEKRSLEAVLPMIFVQVDKVKFSDFGNPCYDNDEKYWRICYLPYQWELAENFANMCQEAGIRQLDEKGLKPEAYVETIKDYMVNGRKVHLFAKNIYQNKELPYTTVLANPPSPKYAGGNIALLTDGRMGEKDYRYNWLGFEGTDFEAVLRMDDTVSQAHLPEIKQIKATFYQDQNSWIFFPDQITLEISYDGITFKPVQSIERTVEKDREKSILTVEKMLDKPEQVRAIRVRGHNIKKCPTWHVCNGNPCWIFIDEIEVR